MTWVWEGEGGEGGTGGCAVTGVWMGEGGEHEAAKWLDRPARYRPSGRQAGGKPPYSACCSCTSALPSLRCSSMHCCWSGSFMLGRACDKRGKQQAEE